MTKAQRDIRRKLRVLNYAQQIGNISKTCRYFGISRQTYYDWKRAYEKDSEEALINSKPCPENPKLRTPPEIEEKILHLRRNYHFGPMRICWNLKRYHDIQISTGGISGVLKRNGLNRHPRNSRPRTVIIHRYEKQMPGRHIKVDVKFLKFQERLAEIFNGFNIQQ